MLAQGSAAAEAVAVCRQESDREHYAWARNWRTKRSAGAAVQTENGVKPRSKWTRKQTRFRLLVRLTDCGRNANYRVMRIDKRPEGRLLTDTSEPCGHRLSGDEAGFGALASEGRCVTGIKRADTANEIQDRAGASNEVFAECQRNLRARWSFNECRSLAVDGVIIGL